MNEEKQEKEPFIRSVFDIAEMMVIAVMIVFALFMFVARPCRVDGDSMNNTLHDGQLLIISPLCYTPQAGDVIVFHQTSAENAQFNEPIVKRVIALGGQYVKIDTESGKVYVSDDEIITEDEAINEDYIYLDCGYWRDYYHVSGKVTRIPEGSVFVMGDNRNNSADSRYYVIGCVDTRRILGKVLLRLTPLSKFGTI